MFKFLLLLAIAGFLWWRWQQRAGARPPPRREAVPERMVSCARCGVFQPEKECVVADGRHYCSEAHRQAGPEAARR